MTEYREQQRGREETEKRVPQETLGEKNRIEARGRGPAGTLRWF